MQRLRLTRDVTRGECDWLGRDFHAGEVVYSYPRYTYGCIKDDGRAVTERPGVDPFFELPAAALEALGSVL